MVASIRGLTVWYPDAAAPALRDIDLDVHAGELVLLCGPSGGGKSTLLRLLQGIVPQRSGGDLVGAAAALGLDVTRTAPHVLAAAGITLLYQNPLEGFVAERVGDEIAFGPESLGLTRDEITERVREAIGLVGLEGQELRALTTLSGGEHQRVALASALALRPTLLLLDEPTAHLDEPAAIAAIALLDRIRRDRGTTLLLAEHRLAAVAHLADRVAVLAGGALRALGPPRVVLADAALAALGVPVPRATQAAIRLDLIDRLPLTPAELAARIAVPRPRTARAAPPPDAPFSAGAAGTASTVRLAGVRYRYPRATVDTLVDVSLALRPGERVALVGPSGAGKSTLARIVVGLRRPTAGSIVLLGRTGPALAQVAAGVALVVQNPLRQLLGETVAGEVAMGLRGADPREARRRIDAVLDRFGLLALRDRHPLSLSEGQRRRVTLAGVLVRRPRLLVLDEPTLAQDELQRAVLTDLLRELAATGTAILAVSHDREFVNDAFDRVVTLRDGRLVADLPLSGEPAGVGRLREADVPLGDVPATVRELAARGIAGSARTVDDLVAAMR